MKPGTVLLGLVLGIAVLGACRRHSTTSSPEAAQRAPESVASSPAARGAALTAPDGGPARALSGSLESQRRSIDLGRIQFVPVDGEQGDPDNRIAELRFPGYPGDSAAERQAAAVTTILGAAPDPLSGARADDPELAAATRRAQARLPAVAAAFHAGLPLGERIAVKAPFDTDDGSIEWMWVGVTGWTGDIVTGNLENDPAEIRELRRGAKVEVKQRSIADYFWYRADGSRKEGGRANRSSCDAREGERSSRTRLSKNSSASSPGA